MTEVFSDRDLSGAVFWGVNLTNSLFRDADLSGSKFFHTGWTNVEIDGEIRGLIVNGVDIAEYVNAHDRWYPLRNNLSPMTADGIRSSWAMLVDEWTRLLDKVPTSNDAVTHASVNDEWSLRDTLRHLLFAVDKWFTGPVLGETSFSALGLPNSESQDQPWPGVDVTANPTFREVLEARAEQHQKFAEFISHLDLDALPDTFEIPENGRVPNVMCFHVVLEEEFEHLRYAMRDLAVLGIS